jgi:hypothetical protein
MHLHVGGAVMVLLHFWMDEHSLCVDAVSTLCVTLLPAAYGARSTQNFQLFTFWADLLFHTDPLFYGRLQVGESLLLSWSMGRVFDRGCKPDIRSVLP